MSFLKNFLIGISIGAGAILPGISSGVICVIFGIYEKLLDSILNFFKDLKQNIKFLLPVFVGGAIGIILFGNFLSYALNNYQIATKSIFIGLIFGSVPKLFKEMYLKLSKTKFILKKIKKLKIQGCICFFIALIIGIITVILENKLQINSINNANLLYLIICGILMSIGVVVPRSK